MNTLRIGWATPWHARSAVAQAASEVAEELAGRGHELTILRTECGAALAEPPRSIQWPVHHLTDLPDEELRQRFDVVAAHIGNHFPNHGAITSRLRGIGAVGIFHDAYLADLAGGWALASGGGGTSRLREIVAQLYGAGTWPPDQGYSDPERIEQIARDRPMLEWLARDCVGAVAHANHYSARLRSACLGPVEVIPLAMTFQSLPQPPPRQDMLTIAVIGHANPNKRIDELILAIGASHVLRKRSSVLAIGEASASEQARLEVMARAVGVQLRFTGWVDDEQLRMHLAKVDVISCLRYPVLEGASASLILAMLSGRPTMVSAHGCYTDVPEDAVLLCTPGDEAVDVIRHLEALLADPNYGTKTGKRAQIFAATRDSPAAYADALLPLLTKTIRMRPIIQAKQSLVETCRSFGLTQNDSSYARMCSGIDMFVTEDYST